MPDENHPDQSAAEAFEHLRSEVALLRRAVEGMAAASVESAAPDYSPTLAGLRKAIDGVGARVESLAANPPMTSAQLAAGIAAAGMQGRNEGQRDLAQARAALEKGARDLTHAAGAVHAVRADRRKLVTAGVGGAILGVVIWVGLSGPIQQGLPDTWHLPGRVPPSDHQASQTESGLMSMPDGTLWRELPEDSKVIRANAGRIDSCRAKARRTGRMVSCEVAASPG